MTKKNDELRSMPADSKEEGLHSELPDPIDEENLWDDPDDDDDESDDDDQEPPDEEIPSLPVEPELAAKQKQQPPKPPSPAKNIPMQSAPVILQLQQPPKPAKTPKPPKDDARKKKWGDLDDAKMNLLAAMGVSPEASWNFKIHVYRESPASVYDPGSDQEIVTEGYLGEYTEPVGEEDIKRKYGGGTYKLVLYGPTEQHPHSSVKLKQHIVTVAGDPNLDIAPTFDPTERREQTYSQKRALRRQSAAPTNSSSDINERLIERSTTVISDEVERLRRREAELLTRADRLEEKHRKEVEKMQSDLDRFRAEQHRVRNDLDPIQKQLLNKALNEENPFAMAEKIHKLSQQGATPMAGVTDSVRMLADSVTKQMENTVSMLQRSFEGTQKLVQQQMELQSKSFEERMSLMNRQMELIAQQGSSSGKQADPQKQMESMFSMMTAMMNFAEKLKGSKDDEPGNGNGEFNNVNNMPWWAGAISDVVGKALFQVGPGIGHLLGVPKEVLQEQVKRAHLQRTALTPAEPEPADIDDDDLDDEETLKPPPQPQQQPQALPEPDLDPREVKLMSIVSLIEEAMVAKRTEKEVSDEVYPLLKKFISDEPTLLTADPNFMWSYMKNFAAPDSPFATDDGRKFTVQIIDLIRNRYTSEEISQSPPDHNLESPQ